MNGLSAGGYHISIGDGIDICPDAHDANFGQGINIGHARNLYRQQESNSFDVVYLLLWFGILKSEARPSPACLVF